MTAVRAERAAAATRTRRSSRPQEVAVVTHRLAPCWTRSWCRWQGYPEAETRKGCVEWECVTPAPSGSYPRTRHSTAALPRAESHSNNGRRVHGRWLAAGRGAPRRRVITPHVNCATPKPQRTAALHSQRNELPVTGRPCRAASHRPGPVPGWNEEAAGKVTEPAHRREVIVYRRWRCAGSGRARAGDAPTGGTSGDRLPDSGVSAPP